MTKIEIDQISQEIMDKGFQIPLWSYLIMLITAFIGAYLAAYIKQKAVNLATKENYESLLKQVKKTTSETESIKLELAKGSWLHQQSWQLKEKYYFELISALFQYKEQIDNLLELYMYPGSEHDEKSIQGRESYKQICIKSSYYHDLVVNLQGPSEIILNKESIDALNKLKSNERNAFHNTGCEKEYLEIVKNSADKAYNIILESAKIELIA